MSFLHRICPCCFGNIRDHRNMQQQQSHAGSRFRRTSSHRDNIPLDAGHSTHSIQELPQNEESLLQHSSRQDLVGFHLNDVRNDKARETQLGSESKEFVDEAHRLVNGSHPTPYKHSNYTNYGQHVSGSGTLTNFQNVQNYIAGNIVVHEDDSMKQVFTRLEQHAINQNLAKLNVSPFAAYDSSEVSEKASCFKGTRVRLLNEIASWIAGDDPSPAPIYVLDGVAGIGKSTIAKTVAEQAARVNVLGASFFFSRNDDKRKKAVTFFPTIAYQLAYYNNDFADKINEALLRTPYVERHLPLAQFSTLIMEPLKEAFAVAGNPILIVIDALDECEHDGDALLKIFADSITRLPRLKLFITTRPEFHIRNVLDRYYHLRRFHLQDIEKSVVQSDIRLYLHFHLSESQVRDALQYTWKPAEEDMELLIETCGTLFIIASTAVKFILDDKQLDPGAQLRWLLRGVSHNDFSGSNPTTVMDSFYTQILLSAVPNNNQDKWFGRYQTVVGTIVALQYPLPCLALSTLVDLAPDDVQRALSHLYSLVAPTGQNLTFRIHHKSFPDFVTNPSRCERKFLVDLTTRHLELGKQCLKIIDSHLRPNICNLGAADRFKDNNSIQHLTRECISQELAYASIHWATHLVNVSMLDGEAEKLLENFARKHVLAWLEVLSITGQVETAYSSLDKIGKLLDGSKTVAGITRELFHDGCRFIALNIAIIKAAAGHVFSAIAFVPQNTRFFRTYRGIEEMSANLRVVSGYEATWNPTISVMTGHEQMVNFVSFSGDGTKLASASNDRTVRLWDGRTGAEIAVLHGHSKVVTSVVFSPDGTRLASASHDGTVRLWDGQTGAEITVLQGHSYSWVLSVAFSPDGTKLASLSFDITVCLWDGQTGAKIAVLQGYLDRVISTRLASARSWVDQSGTKFSRVDQRGAEFAALWGGLNRVSSVVFSPDGTRLASARLWDGQTGAEIATLQGHSDSVNSLAFSPDGTRLASASDDKTVRLWDGQTGAKSAVLQGHQNSVHSVAFSPDGMRLASASYDTTVRLWSCKTGAEIAVVLHPKAVNSVLFSPDGMRLASSSQDGLVRLWDGQTGAENAILQGHSESVNSVVFSPDGTRLASSSYDRTVRLWDGQEGAASAVVQVQPNATHSVVFSSDGTRLASAHYGVLRLWDGQTGAEIAVFGLRPNSVNSVAFSADGTRLASSSGGGAVQLWDGQTGAEIAVCSSSSVFPPDGMTRYTSFESVVFSPDGARLASVMRDQLVLWDGRTGSDIAVLRGHTNLVQFVVFSSDSTRLASASYDGAVRLWDGQKGSDLAVLQLQGQVNSLVFSPDGTRLAVARNDGELQLWDGRTGARIAVLPPYSDSVNSIAFSPDGTKLASVDSYTNKVYLRNGQTGVEIASFFGFRFTAFTLDNSKLIFLNAGEIHQADCITGDTFALPLGLAIDPNIDGVRVPGSDVWVVRVNRKRPSARGLLAVKSGNEGVLRFTFLCWFPPNLVVSYIAVSPLSRICVGCQDGKILLLEVDFSSLL